MEKFVELCARLTKFGVLCFIWAVLLRGCLYLFDIDIPTIPGWFLGFNLAIYFVIMGIPTLLFSPITGGKTK